VSKAGSPTCVDPRTGEQLVDGVLRAVAVERVGVLVAGDHEPRAVMEPPDLAVVVVDVVAGSRGHVVRPEADLVVIAGSVAVLPAVEDRRRRVADEEVHPAAVAHPDRQVPVALRGEPKDVELVRRVPVSRRRGLRVVREQRAGHVLPAKEPEGACVLAVDRQAGEDGEAELPRELAEAEGVVPVEARTGRGHDLSVVVEVLARGDAGVRRLHEAMREPDRLCAVL
jgi:hypothetical protein